uniref:Capsule assembly Wzi family protein n=1 Tax=candidate division WOR-3 bacterium TaxID=2052148 RepID=A0A7C6EIE2_UNCW3
MLIFLIYSVFYPIDFYQNELIEELQVRGYFFTKFPGVRPYSFDANEMELNDSLKEEVLWLYDHIWMSNVRVTLNYDTIKTIRFKPMVNYNFSNFSFYLQPDVKFGTDSLPPSKVFENLFSADYERAYTQYQNSVFRLFIGRERFSIGPSPRYNMLLSGYGAPMDWFHYALTAKYIKLSYYLCRLDDMVCKPVEYIGDTISTIINARRYLIIKRLDWTPVQWLNCSFSEAATFGGENYSLMLYHFNPIVFIHTLQHNWEKDANLFFHLDLRLFFKNFSVYSALLVDDYQLEPDPNGEPNHLGVNFGIELADFFIDHGFLMLEYHLLTRWIYAIYAPYQRYNYYGHPIGFPYGNDCDEVYAKYTYHINKNFDIYLEGSYLRKGENQVNSIWPIPEKPRVPGTSFPDDNFLSGIIEKTFNTTFGIRFFYQKVLLFDTDIGFLKISNQRHIENQSKNVFQFHFSISFLRL